MYINFGNNLFMPEGDDYSKNDFDMEAEKIVSDGNAILHQLRMQHAAEQLEKNNIMQDKIDNNFKKENRKIEKEDKKLNFKELINSVSASK